MKKILMVSFCLVLVFSIFPMVSAVGYTAIGCDDGWTKWYCANEKTGVNAAGETITICLNSALTNKKCIPNKCFYGSCDIANPTGLDGNVMTLEDFDYSSEVYVDDAEEGTRMGNLLRSILNIIK